jgi:hypothetical protein
MAPQQPIFFEKLEAGKFREEIQSSSKIIQVPSKM